MSTDAIGYSLFLLVAATTFVAVRYRNLLLTLGASVLWMALLAFILANTTAGENWQVLFIGAATAFFVAFALISFFSRSKSDRSFTENIGGLMSREKEERPPATPRRGIMDMDYNEYRAYLRTRLRRRRR